MTKNHIDLVRQSFERMVPVSDEAAVLFYAKLFDLDSAVKPLFEGGIAEQGRKLMQMLAIAVEGLDDIERLVPILNDLGARHVAYGVKESHYDTVGKALIWTFARALGDSFTSETKEAWCAIYGLIADAMKIGARRSAKGSFTEMDITLRYAKPVEGSSLCEAPPQEAPS